MLATALLEIKLMIDKLILLGVSWFAVFYQRGYIQPFMKGRGLSNRESQRMQARLPSIIIIRYVWLSLSSFWLRGSMPTLPRTIEV